MKNLMEFSFAFFLFLIFLQKKIFFHFFFECYELHFLQKILLLVSVYMYKKNEVKMTQIWLIYKKN
jgi:hypothetical protein